MNRKESFRYALRIFLRRESILVIVIVAFAFGWIYQALFCFGSVLRQMGEKVELRCTVSQNAFGELKRLETEKTVQAVTKYRACTAELSFQGYNLEVMLVGLDRAFLEEKYREELAVPLSATMPYLIVDMQTLETMKNGKDEYLQIHNKDEFLLQILKVNDNKNARICAIIDPEVRRVNEEHADEKIYTIYTTLEGYERLVAGSQGSEASADDGGMDTEESSDTEDSAQELVGIQEENVISLQSSNSFSAEKDYLILLKNGYHLKSVCSNFEEDGIAVLEEGESNPMDWVEKWDAAIKDGRWNLWLGAVSLVCMLCLCVYQRRLWEVQHKAFLDYICIWDKGENTGRRILRFLYLLIFLSGAGAGWLFYFNLWLWKDLFSGF